MSRVIKFRQWYQGHLQYWGFTKDEGARDSHFTSPVHCSDNRFPVMQFTGLKDKNGVEIYEKSVIDGFLYVDYIPSRYILRRLQDNSIKCNLDEYYNEDTTEVTEEYRELQKNS